MQEFIITMPCKVGTDNSNEFAKLISTELENAKQEDCVVFDADNMKYISSAGLREILRTRKNYPNTKVINCSIEVYDIFNTTGFVDILPVEKKMRYVDVEHLKLVGQGGQGKVYAGEDGWIIKAYVPSVTAEMVKNEDKVAKYLFSLGFPTAIPFEMIRHNTGYGITYEMIADGSLSDCANSGKIEIDSASGIMADLFNQIHTLVDEKHLLPETKELFISAIEDVGTCFFNEEETKSLRILVEAIGDGNTIIHGDFHPKNIVLSDEDYYAIDIGEVSRGNVIYDYLITYFDIVTQINLDKNMSEYMGMEPEELFRLWEGMKPKIIIGRNKEEYIAAIRLLDKLGWLQAVRLLSRHLAPKKLEEEATQCVRERLLPDIDDTIKELKRLEHCFGKQKEIGLK